MIVKRIVLHERPHLSDLVAVALLLEYGGLRFPGILQAELVFSREYAQSLTLVEHEREGNVVIGMCGGEFDEHKTRDTSRKERECEATLVAKGLGVERYPELQKILKYTLIADTSSGKSPFELAMLTQMANRNPSLCSEEVSAMIVPLIRAFIHEQAKRIRAGIEFRDSIYRTAVIYPGGKQVNIVVLTSDNKLVMGVARSRGYGLVIMRDTSGNVAISVDKHLSYLKFVAMIVNREGELRGRPPINAREVDDGPIPDTPEWYLFKSLDLFLNGSDSAPDIPPTLLSLDEFLTFAMRGIALKN